MADRSCVYLVTEQHKAVINRIFEAMGLGPDNIAQPASPDGHEPVTHRYGHAYADEATSAAWLALAEGTLPPIFGAWGEDGLPTEQEAIAATAGFTVSVAAGAIPSEHLAGMMTGIGLRRIETD